MRKRLWLVLLLLLTMHHVYAQLTSGFERLVYNSQGDTLPYRLLYPAGYKKSIKYPLILFLHGSGARGSDNELQLTNLPAVFTDSLTRVAYPCFVLVPQCAKKDAWVNFPDFPRSLHATDTPSTSASLTLALAEELMRTFNIDKSRVYITGYSMGGEGTFDLIARKPHMFAAAVPICPVADTATAGHIRNIPVWVFHGESDSVNSVIYSRMMVNALKRAGGAPRYTEYTGVGHRCWNKAYTEPGLIQWLFHQKKNNGKH